jgi:hypothetical protein
LIQNAIRRQKVYEKLNELKFPEVMFGVPKPISENSANFEVDGDVLARG